MIGKKVKTPSGLSRPAVAWFKKLVNEYRIYDTSGLILLEQAMRSFDRSEEARRLLDDEGAVVIDRFNQKRQHPAFQIERDSRAAMIKAFASLGIDGAPTQGK